MLPVVDLIIKEETGMDLKSKFRHVPNFPKEGIDFIDITTVLQDAESYSYLIDLMIEKIKDIEFDIIVSPESRGFILGGAVAYAMKKGFVPIRKKGKLPYRTISAEYQLEYGSDIVEMHQDAIKPGQRVVIVDDLIATGGTMRSNAELVEKLGGKVAAIVCPVELTFLPGRENLKRYDVYSIVEFEEQVL